MSSWSGTTRRLVVAFGALVLLFALASFSALAGLEQINAGLDAMREREAGVRLSLELATAVRDQYAHQAHTIIIGNETHLAFYRAASEHVRELAARVLAHCESADERSFVADIERGSRDLDQLFAEQIVPAVLSGRMADVQHEHARAQQIVSLIQERTDRLVGSFDAAITAFRQRVGGLERRTFLFTVAFLLAAPVLAALVVFTIGRSIARPVSLLQQGAARLAKGDLTTRIDLDTPDEFGALARQFNAMTAALGERERQLVESEKLAGIGRLAAGVAHEINNPLGVMLGYTRLLKKTAAGALADDLQIIEDETMRCQQIVEGLLDLSRPLVASPTPVDLRALCDEVKERLGATAQFREVDLVVTGSGCARGSAGKLRQVVLNLMKNAAEAAGPTGHVRVEVRAAGDRVEVEIQDSGPGISEAVQARLFEPFFTTKPTGTGLGLAVSRAIVRAFGGDVEARSIATGASFLLRLQRAGEEKV
jgi:two-component system, NtrC family, sensor kinase